MKKDMKAYNTIYNTILCGVAAIALSSCGDFLDKLPDERVEITTEDQVVMLLTTGYSAANYGWICELSSDNLIDVNSPFYAPQTDGTEIRVYYNLSSYERMDDEAFKFEPVESSTDTDSPSAIWEYCYNAIATANHALEYIEEFKEEAGGTMSSTLAAAYAEALLIRAYHHFILVNVFSQAWKNEEDSKNDIGVPYVTETESDLVKEYERSNVADTYAKIEEDLIEGLTYVSDINYDYPKWHFNVNAAKAFAARFYLYKRDYEKVIEYADDVLGTDRSALSSKLMDCSGFDDATSSTDYAEIWQGPDEANNLLLMATYSLQFRRTIGYRYAFAGDPLQSVMMRTGPTWNWTILPIAMVAGETFYDGTIDHGFTSARVCERFEYTDKVAGIGYAHVVRREFTCAELLLERVEALILGRGDYETAVEDLIAYEASRQSFSDDNYTYYSASNAMKDLTMAIVQSYYDPSTSNYNVLDDWSFTQNMSSDFVVPEEMYTYMNALNDFKRYETAFTGRRFFDLKRWGMEWSHTYGDAESSTTVTLAWDDERRAIEVPQEVLAAGLSSSYDPVQVSNTSSASTASTYSGAKYVSK